MDKLKCYKVTVDGGDYCVLVFAINCNKAKSLASNTDWLCETDYIDLICTREPNGDANSHKFGEGALDKGNQSEQELMRSLGWYQVEESFNQCETCELFEWSDIEDSYIDDTGDCGRCRNG